MLDNKHSIDWPNFKIPESETKFTKRRFIEFFFYTTNFLKQ